MNILEWYLRLNTKTLFPKQMLQRLPIALARLKSDKISKSLLNEIRQIIYFCIKKKKLLRKYIVI